MKFNNVVVGGVKSLWWVITQADGQGLGCIRFNSEVRFQAYKENTNNVNTYLAVGASNAVKEDGADATRQSGLWKIFQMSTPPKPQKPVITVYGYYLKVSWVTGLGINPQSRETSSNVTGILVAVRKLTSSLGAIGFTKNKSLSSVADWSFSQQGQGDEATLVPTRAGVSNFVNGARTFILLCNLIRGSKYEATLAFQNEYGWGAWSQISDATKFDFGWIRLTSFDSSLVNGDYKKMTASVRLSLKIDPALADTPYTRVSGDLMLIYKAGSAWNVITLPNFLDLTMGVNVGPEATSPCIMERTSLYSEMSLSCKLTKGTTALAGSMKWLTPYMAFLFEIERANGLYFEMQPLLLCKNPTTSTHYSNKFYILYQAIKWRIGLLLNLNDGLKYCRDVVYDYQALAQPATNTWATLSFSTSGVVKKGFNCNSVVDASTSNTIRSCRSTTQKDSENKSYMLTGSYCVDKSLKDARGVTVSDAWLTACANKEGFQSSTQACPPVYQVWYNRDAAQWCTNGECINSMAASPLEIGRAAFTGKWSVMLLTDFVMEPAMGAGAQEVSEDKPKPNLLKFTSIENKEECKSEVNPSSEIFSLEKMNKVGMTMLEKGGNPRETGANENPCGHVAGKQQGEKLSGMSFETYAADDVVHMGSSNGLGFKMGLGQDARGTAEERKEGRKISGLTYNEIRKCELRASYRPKMRVWKAQHIWKRDKFMEAAMHLYTLACSLVPEVDVAPGGAGAVFDGGKICNLTASGKDLAKLFIAAVDSAQDVQMDLGEMKDCVPEDSSWARIFCDMFCIRNIMSYGDKASLDSLAKMETAATTNLNMITGYYGGKVLGEVAALKASQLALQKPKLLEQAQTSKGRLLAMFTELRSMLGSNIHSGGLVTAQRSIDAFARKFSNPIIQGMSNASKLMEDMASETTHLMSTIHVATTNRLSLGAAASRQTASALHGMSARLRNRNLMLGVYQTSILESKHLQAELSWTGSSITSVKYEVENAAVSNLLMEFERSWWTIREKLDAYMDEADSQAKGFGNALVVLEDYTQHCTANFRDLYDAQSRVARSQRNSEIQLRNTWQYVVHELGQLTSQIADTHAFNELSRWDISAAFVQVNRTTICGGGSAARAAARIAAMEISKAGLSSQTWMQMNGIFEEMPWLFDQFDYLGLPKPGNVEVLEQAQARSQLAFSEDMLQPLDGALELVSKVCRRES